MNREGLPQALLPTAAPAHEHVVAFYDEGRFPVEEVAEFLAEGIESGGAALAIARPDHLQRLRNEVDGLLARTTHRADGALVLLDAQQVLQMFMRGGRPDRMLFDQAVGRRVAALCGAGRPLRAYGEMVALLCDEGHHAAALELELLWNELATRQVFSLMCAYAWKLFPHAEHGPVFRQICAQHRRVLPATRSQPQPAAGMVEAELQQRTLALQNEVGRRQQADAARLQRERELADFVENAAEGLHKVGRDGVVLWANRAELELLGWEWHEYVGHHIAEFHADRGVIDSMLQRLLAGQTLRDQPARLRCKNGSIKPVLINSNACFEDGQLLYTRCFTRDATAIVEREKLLSDLAAASRAKDEFLAMLGHELRNPLSPIVTALALMRARGDGSTTREQEVIQRQVGHLTRLLDDLLDVARITRAGIDLSLAPVALDKVVNDAVEMTQPLLQQRRHGLSVDVPASLVLVADRVRLAQVVGNLLTNAAKYTPPGGEVGLRAWTEGNEVCLSVTDNGRGIPAATLGRIFELFYQAGQSVDRPEGGLGIGLALVKSLVELHGGSVRAESAGPGLGSRFLVRLPADASATTAAPAPALAPDQLAEGAAQPNYRIAIVDDNADASELLAMLLTEHGHQVRTYGDARGMLGDLAGFRPDVAVLDIGLPGMDGHDLARALRASRLAAGCTLIALTGYGQAADRQRSQAAGFDRHLVKPADALDVLAAVAAARAVRCS